MEENRRKRLLPSSSAHVLEYSTIMARRPLTNLHPVSGTGFMVYLFPIRSNSHCGLC